MTMAEKFTQLLGFIPEIVEMIFATATSVATWVWSEPLALIPCLIGLGMIGIKVFRSFAKTK